jgi:dimeric dUTPase (all-alpha-NTP-PPase superfamily)
MIIKYETFKFIVNQQKILDAAFLPVSRWIPDTDDRHLALQVEKGEFLKEFQKEIKWWKQQAVNNPVSILDEYIDLWHFVAGMILTDAEPMDMKEIYRKIDAIAAEQIKFAKYTPEKKRVKLLLNLFSNANNRWNMLGIATAIITTLGYNDAQIKQQYITKNKVNFERIANGY